jgi:hypothetical protein
MTVRDSAAVFVVAGIFKKIGRPSFFKPPRHIAAESRTVI